MRRFLAAVVVAAIVLSATTNVFVLMRLGQIRGLVESQRAAVSTPSGPALDRALLGRWQSVRYLKARPFASQLIEFMPRGRFRMETRLLPDGPVGTKEGRWFTVAGQIWVYDNDTDTTSTPTYLWQIADYSDLMLKVRLHRHGSIEDAWDEEESWFML